MSVLEPTTRLATTTIAPKTIYVDGDATGGGTGVSWTDAFTTIQAAVDSLPQIIAHNIDIICRKATNPYRETVDISGHVIIPALDTDIWHPYERLIIEGEYWGYGDCEANVGGAGEITDTGAFADVQVGDTVIVFDLNGAGGLCQNYQKGVVDDITNIPNRIGTTLTVTPSTNWKYAWMRTEISGSDDGVTRVRTDNWDIQGVNNVAIKGFLNTFSLMRITRSKRISCWANYFAHTANGIGYGIEFNLHSDGVVYYLGVDGSAVAGTPHQLYCGYHSWITAFYCGLSGHAGGHGICLATDTAEILIEYSYFPAGDWALQAENNSQVWAVKCTITNGVATGARVLDDSIVRFTSGTNNALAVSNLTEGSQYVTN